MNTPSTRGPLDHSVREQIVEAAFEHFGHYGYEKTTVAELAKSIGFSKAYLQNLHTEKANNIIPFVKLIEIDFNQQLPEWYVEPNSQFNYKIA